MRFLVAACLVLALAAPPGLAERQTLPDVDAEPVRPPQPVFPPQAAELGISGICAVIFDVDTLGRTGNVRAYCTHTAFCSSSVAAMNAVRFKPARRDGRIVARANVVYPLEYQLEDTPLPDLNEIDPISCVDPNIF
ncbi:MAG: energy transducer TonB [Hyphomonas sp.]